MEQRRRVISCGDAVALSEEFWEDVMVPSSFVVKEAAVSESPRGGANLLLADARRISEPTSGRFACERTSPMDEKLLLLVVVAWGCDVDAFITCELPTARVIHLQPGCSGRRTVPPPILFRVVEERDAFNGFMLPLVHTPPATKGHAV